MQNEKLQTMTEHKWREINLTIRCLILIYGPGVLEIRMFNLLGTAVNRCAEKQIGGRVLNSQVY